MDNASYQHICSECASVTNTEHTTHRKVQNRTVSAHANMYTHMLKEHGIRITIGCHARCGYINQQPLVV